MMKYPCIIFNLDNRVVRHADNLPYHKKKRYQVTVIDQDPISRIPDAVADFPLCAFERRFVANQLYHDVFNLYF